MKSQSPIDLDIQGHRGARGLYPENTIPGFEHALKLGVHTLEMDVVISKDEQVVVSHDPYMSSEICLNLEGDNIDKKDEKSFNLFQMEYSEILKYDCGSKFVPRFPDQKKMIVHKPLLRDVIDSMEKLSHDHFYNIEIKRVKGQDGIFHPDYRKFADLLVQVLVESRVLERTTIQCFDIETLQYLHEKYTHAQLVFLVENQKNIKVNIEKLGFTPHIYSPYYKLVDNDMVSFCSDENMLLIPWTVNKEEDMNNLISLGVDGIITDYPNLLIQVVSMLR